MTFFCTCAYGQRDSPAAPRHLQDKIAKHNRYRDILNGNAKQHRAERRARRMLYGTWESIDDSTLSKKQYAKTKLNKGDTIKKHGIHVTKHEITVISKPGYKVYTNSYLWGINDDTLYFGTAPYGPYGDTFISTQHIVALSKERIVLEYGIKDTLTSVVTCGTSPEILARISMSKPGYQGNMQQHLDSIFKNFNPPGESYETTLSFIVNCNGDVLKIYPFVADRDEFEKLAIKAIKTSGKWMPASYKSETYDATMDIGIKWHKGFVDYYYPKRNR